jgi:hypothetical protein
MRILILLLLALAICGCDKEVHEAQMPAGLPANSRQITLP